jgi:hypothetical protein
VRRLLLPVAIAAALTAGGAAPAHAATNECRGLQICVRVAGPWVAVPAPAGVPRPRVEFQLSCPRRYIVGGLDAELSDRGIEVSFLGKLGSPVNPGITTSRAAVFVARYAGRTATAPTFRPHIGCVPSSGGGGGPVPYRVGAAAAPVQTTIRRVTTLHIRSGSTQRAVRTCAAGERLVAGMHAIGFYTSRPPSAALVSSIRARQQIGVDRVAATVQSSDAVRGMRAIVQLAAVCGGGP